MKKIFLTLGFFVLSLGTFMGGTWTDLSAREPLLVPNKKTLYQRVITHPDTHAYNYPDGQTIDTINAFTPLYVYGETYTNGIGWLEVSPSSHANVTQWIKKEKTSRWDKALSLTFTERMGRNSVMFFRSYDDLNKLITSSSLENDLYALIGKYTYGTDKSNTPLVAMEPTDTAIPQKSFYLMPVIDYSLEYETYGMNVLKVSCINPGSGTNNSPQQVPQKAAPRQFKAGVAFVVDTTISMGPYIEKTKEFIGNTYDKLETSPLSDNLSLSVIAYRNNTDYNEKIEYISKVISPLTTVSDRRSMERALDDFNEATVSTHSFHEDAFAGIMSAVDKLDWDPYSIKLVVLITDAGAIKSNDRYSSTGLNEDDIRDLLAQKGIKLMVIHLETPVSKKHLKQIKRQYEIATSVKDANLKSIYLTIPASNTNKATKKFENLSQVLVNMLCSKMEAEIKGERLEKPSGISPQTEEEKLAQIVDCIGYAAQLEFLGNEKNTKAPHTIETWTVDKDIVSLANGKPTEALSVSILLTKRQLDSLGRQMQIVLDAFRSSQNENSTQFFQNIVSLSASTMRDPNKLQEGNASSIAEMGILPEFLEGLPYKSTIMKLTAKEWEAFSSLERDTRIAELESKIKLYKEYHNDTANWVSFGSQDPADSMYRVPLTSLP